MFLDKNATLSEMIQSEPQTHSMDQLARSRQNRCAEASEQAASAKCQPTKAQLDLADRLTSVFAFHLSLTCCLRSRA